MELEAEIETRPGRSAPERTEPPHGEGVRRVGSVIEFGRVVAARTVRGYLDAHGYELASSLAYASLISFVPLIACVTVLTSTLFGDAGTGLYPLIRLIVPGVSTDILNSLEHLAEQARAVSGW